MNNLIPLLKPSLSQKELWAVTEVLESGWWGSGPKVAEFEKRFAQFTNSQGCIAVNSCTSALHLAVRFALSRNGENIKKPNIIVPSLTFVSTGLVGLYENLEVRFADVDSNTLCMSVKSVEKLYDSNTIAIIPVHYGGITAPTKELAEKYGTEKVIEDCAHATGNTEAGKYGILSCWSFHPVKNLATGDMGALTYNNLNKKEISTIIQERWCGINLDTYKRENGGYNWEYNIERMGFKYNANDIDAAIALVQLERIYELNGKRKAIAERYYREFGIQAEYQPKLRPPSNIKLMPKSGSYHLFVIRVEPEIRDSLVDFLKSNQISPGVHYKPIHTYPIWKRDITEDLSNTEVIYDQLISLPIFPDMSYEDQTHVIEKIKLFLGIHYERN